MKSVRVTVDSPGCDFGETWNFECIAFSSSKIIWLRVVLIGEETSMSSWRGN